MFTAHMNIKSTFSAHLNENQNYTTKEKNLVLYDICEEIKTAARGKK